MTAVGARLIIGWMLLMSCIAFCLMGTDKHRAKHQKWRIPEKTLFLFSLIGGGIGGTLGMWCFHHKTRHWYFRFGFPVIAAAQIIGLIFLWK